MVLLEQGLTAQALFDTAKELLSDPARRKTMRENLQRMAVVDSAERIYNTILELAARHN